MPSVTMNAEYLSVTSDAGFHFKQFPEQLQPSNGSSREGPKLQGRMPPASLYWRWICSDLVTSRGEMSESECALTLRSAPLHR